MVKLPVSSIIIYKFQTSLCLIITLNFADVKPMGCMIGSCTIVKIVTASSATFTYVYVLLAISDPLQQLSTFFRISLE